MEVSRIPSINIARRFDFLNDYQHFCTEQITSCAMPLLVIDRFREVERGEAETIRKNITEAIRNIYGRQLANGGIVYWPGAGAADEWITSYAGEFLTMAREKGFDVNTAVLARWKSFQTSAARNWNSAGNVAATVQAYRLYSLALAGSPEWGAMNRLKESPGDDVLTRWYLAAAYAVGGRRQPAEELIFNRQPSDGKQSATTTYGSADRDEAVALCTLIALDRMADAFDLARSMAERMAHETWFDTQSTAQSLVALAAIAEKSSGQTRFEWTFNGQSRETVATARTVYIEDLPTITETGSLSIVNRGQAPIFVSLTSRTRPLRDTVPVTASHISVTAIYAGADGKPIDPSVVKQGEDITATVTVANLSPVNDYTNLALTHIIPSGWEILNDRMLQSDEQTAGSPKFDYRDIRDDRIMTYFSLPRNSSRQFAVRLQATYEGHFTLPAITCEAMYAPDAFAKTAAGRVEVKSENK